MKGTPITWDDYFTVRIAVWAVSIILAFIVGAIVAVVQWREDCHVNDEPDPNEPKAGKTLGL